MRAQQLREVEQRKGMEQAKATEAYAEEVRQQNARQAAAMESQAQDAALKAGSALLADRQYKFSMLDGFVELRNRKEAVAARSLVQSMMHDALGMEKVIGRRINVWGRVEALDRDPDGNPYARLEARDEFGAVRCLFAPGDAERLRSILGRYVIIEGTLEGSTLGIVKMSACKFTN